MRFGAMRGAALGLGLAVGLALLSPFADAQVTYQTGAPPPGALPPIDSPPPAAPPATVPAVPAPPAATPTVESPPVVTAPVGAAPVPPDSIGAAPSPDPAAAQPVAPAAGKPDVNNPVKQTGEVLKDVAKGDVKALRDGPLLIHGNYCGIGNRPNTPPTDALDEACMHHDACTTEGKLPNCACNNRLKSEAMRIARDPATPAKIQVLAATMAASMSILICK